MQVVRELINLITERGKPEMIVSDNGTELTSNAVLAWCGEAGVEWHYIARGPLLIQFSGERSSRLAIQGWRAGFLRVIRMTAVEPTTSSRRR